MVRPRRLADAIVGVATVAVLLIGGVTGWQLARRQAVANGMMGQMGPSGMQPTWPYWWLVASVLLAAVILLGYVAIRSRLFNADAERSESRRMDDDTETANKDPIHPDESAASSSSDDARRSRYRAFLEVLPDDERRVLEPVLEAPGITQIALRDRADFSKSKISQTVSELEKRGLLYRERQGRTFRVYPADDLPEREER